MLTSTTLIFFSACDSETDTEEFEQVGQSPLERHHASTSTTDVSQPPETTTMSTSTLAISIRNVETITEVRSHISHIEHCYVKRPLSYYSIQGPSNNKTNPPKKPPRLPNKPTSSSQKPIPDTLLPSIPEIHSPDLIAKKCIYQSSDTSSSDDISSTTGHHNNCQHTMTSDIYPHRTDICNTDGEFIHSEFYIDESLPSSLSSPQDEQKLLKYDSSSDDLRQGDGSHDGRKYFSDLCIRQINNDCDDANGAVIHLLQVLHQIE